MSVSEKKPVSMMELEKNSDTNLEEVKLPEKVVESVDEKAVQYEKIVMDLYKKSREFLADGELSQSEIIRLLPLIMRGVEEYKGLSGSDKKKIVISVLEKLIDAKVKDKEVSDMLKLLVHTTVPTLIDTLVSIDKKELRIKLQKGLKRIFCC